MYACRVYYKYRTVFGSGRSGFVVHWSADDTIIEPFSGWRGASSIKQNRAMVDSPPLLRSAPYKSRRGHNRRPNYVRRMPLSRDKLIAPYIRRVAYSTAFCQSDEEEKTSTRRIFGLVVVRARGDDGMWRGMWFLPRGQKFRSIGKRGLSEHGHRRGKKNRVLAPYMVSIRVGVASTRRETLWRWNYLYLLQQLS